MKLGITLFRLGVAKKSNDTMVGGWEDWKGNEVRFRRSIKEVNDRGKELRKRAREWAAAFEDGNKLEEPRRWLELHEYAAECFNFIFGDHARYVRDALAASSGDIGIWVKQGTIAIEMPWGLLCSPSDVPSADGGDDRPVALWGSKFNLTVAIAECDQSSQDEHMNRSFIPVVCESAFCNQVNALQSAERSLANIVFSKCVIPTVRGVPEPSHDHCFLYVYSHASKTVLNLVLDGQNRQFKPLDLINGFVKPGGSAAVILNACKTTNLVWKMGRALAVTSNAREVAVIATEFNIHERFAMRFGLELIDRCVQLGESTIDAMSVMRIKHHPMSIVYSHYCLREFALMQVQPLMDDDSNAKYREAISDANFSKLLSGGAVQ